MNAISACLCTFGLLLLVWSCPAAIAASKHPQLGATTLASAELETRQVEASSSDIVLRAAISVLQDYRYAIATFDHASGTLSANPAASRWSTGLRSGGLSLAVDAEPGTTGRFVLRISVARAAGDAEADCKAADLRFLQQFQQRVRAEILRQETL